MNGTLSETFLLVQFHDFYGEVIGLKRLVASGSWVAAAAPLADADATRTRLVSTVWQRLVALLEHQELAASRRSGDYGAMFYKQAQYVMVALADETFLQLDWAGKADWQAHLLEERFFDSHSAGDVLFQKLEQLLRSRDPVYTDLAAVYLMALALGFQGKFRGSNDGGQLADYRRQLYAFITHREPGLSEAARRLFPAAHAHTLSVGQSRGLPGAQRWFVLLAGVVLLLFGLSHLLWRQLSTDLYNTMAQILQTQ